MKLRLGSSRLVILHGKYAVKIPILISWRRLVSGTASNYKEYFEWKQSKDSSLCKVHFCFAGLVLVADRAEKVSEEEFRKIDKKQMRKLFRVITFKDELICHNIGKVKGEYVIIDNGIIINDKEKDQSLLRVTARKIRTKLGLL